VAGTQEYKEYNIIYDMIRQESINSINQGYQDTDPFPHIVIDDFLEKDSLDMIVAELRTMNSNDAYYKAIHKPNALEFNKFAFKTKSTADD
jgi:hypothetical protein